MADTAAACRRGARLWITTAVSTLARYIAGRFLMTIIGTYLLCVVLVFMIDFVELLRLSGKYGRVSMLKLVWLGILRLPSFTEMTIPFAVLVGTMGAYLLLSRKSELTIVRAAGMSVWQFMQPGLAVAATLGVLSVVAYNPLAAAGRAEADRVFAQAFGQQDNLLAKSAGSEGAWLRQDGADGPSVIHSRLISNRGMQLNGVEVFQYDRQNKFVERVDAARAVLKEGVWELERAWVVRVGREPELFEHYIISTYLSPERVQDALGAVTALSFWQLPEFIEIAEKAKIPTARYRVQYQLLIARPALLLAMVLLGATVSLRSFRFGKIQTMVILGMGAGFGFFLLAEVSRQIGNSGLTSPEMAAWVPIAVVSFLSLTVLLHQEDG